MVSYRPAGAHSLRRPSNFPVAFASSKPPSEALPRLPERRNRSAAVREGRTAWSRVQWAGWRRVASWQRVTPSSVLEKTPSRTTRWIKGGARAGRRSRRGGVSSHDGTRQARYPGTRRARAVRGPLNNAVVRVELAPNPAVPPRTDLVRYYRMRYSDLTGWTHRGNATSSTGGWPPSEGGIPDAPASTHAVSVAQPPARRPSRPQRSRAPCAAHRRRLRGPGPAGWSHPRIGSS